jgi:hypothetical protein
MKVDFGEPKTVTQTLNKPNPGSFAAEGSNISWVPCREQFANKFNESLEGFYFSHERDKGEDIAAFITKTEEIIEQSPSHFAKTNKNFALWIQPSAFWRNCAIRRSLLTILLRSGAHFNHEEDNYEEALYSHEYVRKTKPAIKRFLFGFTEFIRDEVALGNGHVFTLGWLATFSSKNDVQIRSQLLRLEEEEEYCSVDQDSLWS